MTRIQHKKRDPANTVRPIRARATMPNGVELSKIDGSSRGP